MRILSNDEELLKFFKHFSFFVLANYNNGSFSSRKVSLSKFIDSEKVPFSSRALRWESHESWEIVQRIKSDIFLILTTSQLLIYIFHECKHTFFPFFCAFWHFCKVNNKLFSALALLCGFRPFSSYNNENIPQNSVVVSWENSATINFQLEAFFGMLFFFLLLRWFHVIRVV